jgi:hypothetical protein
MGSFKNVGDLAEAMADMLERILWERFVAIRVLPVEGKEKVANVTIVVATPDIKVYIYHFSNFDYSKVNFGQLRELIKLQVQSIEAQLIKNAEFLDDFNEAHILKLFDIYEEQLLMYVFRKSSVHYQAIKMKLDAWSTETEHSEELRARARELLTLLQK